MKNLNKKLALITFLVIICFGSVVFAASSSTQIYTWQTSADGPEIVMSGNLAVTGSNASTSKRALWIEVYKIVTLWPDSCISSNSASIGGNTTATLNSQPNGMYYIHLDPDGSDNTGCSGSGSVSN